MLETERTILVPLTAADTDLIVSWRNNETMRASLFDSSYLTREQHLQWFENRRDRMDLLIRRKDDWKAIGTINLSSIDRKNQKAEYGILIGELEEWGKGYSYEVSKQLLKYGFLELNLNRIYLKVFEENQRAVALYRKLGFQTEGLLRQEIYKMDRFRDVLIMSILKEEFFNSHLALN